jgi:hypothetical protein
MRLLIKYPTKFRIQACLDQIRRYLKMAKNISNIQIIVSIDNDDPESIQKIKEIESLHTNIKVFIGNPKGKIAAVNRDMPDPSSFDILLLASDDMIPIVQDYDSIIIEKMQEFYPDTDGVLFFNDGYCGPRLNTLVICGSKYYKRFNYIYYPEYKSVYCDNEFMNIAYELNKQTYFHTTIIKHEHTCNNSDIVQDRLFIQNSVHDNADRELYFARYKVKYDISILICTMPKRKSMFDSLIDRIRTLLRDVDITVEILSDDSMDYTIGTKRNLLLYRSRAKYSCFIDDDDQITDEYFKIYETALKTGVDYDCVELNGIYLCNGTQKPFYHSTKITSWYQTEAAYFRFPNHLNLIKTDISKKIYYNDVNWQEDICFATRLFNSKLIKTEYSHDMIQYLYIK